MKSGFKAKIYKVGINPCVKVPFSITEKMKPVKGYIPVTGTINQHSFKQTLCPVKGAEYRLYVNGPMLKGGLTKVGEIARFTIAQNFKPRPEKDASMSKPLKAELTRHSLSKEFESLTAARKKDILKYLNSLKTEETLVRNIARVIAQLQKLKSDPSKKDVRIP
jgi:hypothetical protein